ncbi:MAG: Lrp/AsnC family transcriptional regulator [Desulfohalobiaceae bacterium]|nr:Lrp/AsnC family transcriptional regulator [Desulfohalobiaceae bacterium]
MISDREFIDAAAKGLEFETRPFKPLAEALGLSEEEVLNRLKDLIAQGKVRRFAASVRHQPMGFSVNAMVMVRTDMEAIDQVGQAGSELAAVSHCYQRAHPDGDPCCLYMMVHGQDEDQVQKTVAAIKDIPGVREVEVCRSLAEFKKTSLSGVSTEVRSEDARDEDRGP